MKQYLLVLCFLYGFAPITGTNSVRAQEAPRDVPQESQRSEDDLVHFGDVIDIDVVGGFEYDWRGTLTPDGFLDGLNGFTEPVYGLCRTEAQIASDVARGYGRILREPKVIVKIIDRSNRAVVRLEGAVKTPTRFRLLRTVHLRELLVLAGGLKDSASGTITIFRPPNLSCRPAIIPAANTVDSRGTYSQDNGSPTLNIKISELLQGIKAADPQIFSGDLITVQRALPVYVVGAVNNPRPIYSLLPITVERAVASAGGLAKDADGGKISVFRREGTETRIIAVDLGKANGGASGDEVLKPFDIIDVATKGGGKRRYPPVVATEENSGTIKPELPLRVVD